MPVVCGTIGFIFVSRRKIQGMDYFWLEGWLVCMTELHVWGYNFKVAWPDLAIERSLFCVKFLLETEFKNE